MNKEEKRLLHGLYYHRELIGERLLYKPAELNWLKSNRYNNHKYWQDADGNLKTIDNKTDNYLYTIAATSASAIKPLAYLKEFEYIKYTAEGGMFRVEITGKGANLARNLHTIIGRLNVLYKDNKDGVVWLLITVLVSFITAFLTNKYLP